jgi:hypothetical protein
MRTTLNIDDDLLEQMTRRFPAGTPKTVIIEESLRWALAAGSPGREVSGIGLPDDIALLVARGVIVPAVRAGVPPQGESPPLPAGALLEDLARDREDR